MACTTYRWTTPRPIDGPSLVLGGVRLKRVELRQRPSHCIPSQNPSILKAGKQTPPLSLSHRNGGLSMCGLRLTGVHILTCTHPNRICLCTQPDQCSGSPLTRPHRRVLYGTRYGNPTHRGPEYITPHSNPLRRPMIPTSLPSLQEVSPHGPSHVQRILPAHAVTLRIPR